MRLLIVRHGETEYNKLNLMQGQSDTPLTEEGVSQARKLAGHLSEEKIDLVFSSDLSRALRTTNEIMRFHEVQLIVTEDLRERKLGEFEHRPRADYYAAQAQAEDRWVFRPPGGESLADLEERARRFIPRLEPYSSQTVLVSSHNAFIRVLIKALLGLDRDACSQLKQNNCCLNELAGEDLQHLHAERLGWTKHLI